MVLLATTVVAYNYDCDSDSSEYEDESGANDPGQWFEAPHFLCPTYTHAGPSQSKKARKANEAFTFMLSLSEVTLICENCQKYANFESLICEKKLTLGGSADPP